MHDDGERVFSALAEMVEAVKFLGRRVRRGKGGEARLARSKR